MPSPWWHRAITWPYVDYSSNWTNWQTGVKCFPHWPVAIHVPYLLYTCWLTNQFTIHRSNIPLLPCCSNCHQHHTRVKTSIEVNLPFNIRNAPLSPSSGVHLTVESCCTYPWQRSEIGNPLGWDIKVSMPVCVVCCWPRMQTA